ncbi:MAG: U32 family peptidase [Muribaculaceae bacterium]|nr:U32 family peptidase [Muribaculaceae bacterium]
MIKNKVSIPRPLELLAPARNADIAISAIMAGADAVYIGPDSHGARRAAANTLSDIARVAETAHLYDAKVYATVNTLVYDEEIRTVERLIDGLYHAGVDAIIVQDMGILRMDIPPIDLHASTQCDIRTPEKARFLASAGFSRLVLPRELSLEEIRKIRSAIPEDVELEAFIHGALCVSYSGDCRASYMAGGRSANRGECAQICRLPYDLTDSDGNILVKGKHLLSLRDLNRSSSISDMADAGIMSFKIEGRLKEEAYVKNVTAWYSRILDRIVDESDGRYIRLSDGRSRQGFTPRPEKAFNRGFTSYFLTGKSPASGMASMDSPKAVGERVGKVTACRRGVIEAELTNELTNGDGLGYFDRSGIFTGFRLNKAEGKRLFPATPQNIPAGTILYRNRDKHWDDTIADARCERKIDVEINLRLLYDSRVALEITDIRGNSVTIASQTAYTDTAVTPQEGPRRKILDKLGDTPFRAVKIVDIAGGRFIPASALAAMRRDAVAMLIKARAMTRSVRLRRTEDPAISCPTTTLTIHDNVANRLARQFYTDHGVSLITPAAESVRPEGETMVMTTRYCIRKELGCCLLTPTASKMPRQLYLRSCTSDMKMRVECDCSRCGMNLYMSI